tara:strand:- start:2967 stop:3773 length:807 start_codon:yes stop_codon:yes gene_type:complete
MRKPNFVDGEAWFGNDAKETDKLILIVSGKNDRFGSQYSAQMSAFALARYNDCIYRFTRFKGDKHSEIASDFCGLKSDSDDDILREPDIKYQRHCDVAQGNYVDKYFNENTIKEIREQYYSTWKPEPIQCEIAIHIRRGDVGCIDGWGKKNNDGTPYRHWKQRYDDNQFYVKVINFLRKTYDSNKKIVIFSQGKLGDFQEILDLKDNYLEFCLEGDWRIAHFSLVKAPIMVCSISEFAWTAGLLSEGIVYRNERMFRKPLKVWKKLEI